jgi:hypothetical protein
LMHPWLNAMHPPTLLVRRKNDPEAISRVCSAQRWSRWNVNLLI